MPKFVAPPAGNSAHVKHFDKFDGDASGCIGYQEALLGLRASGLDVDLEQVVDMNKDGRISMQEFPLLAEHADGSRGLGRLVSRHGAPRECGTPAPRAGALRAAQPRGRGRGAHAASPRSKRP